MGSREELGTPGRALSGARKDQGLGLVSPQHPVALWVASGWSQGFQVAAFLASDTVFPRTDARSQTHANTGMKCYRSGQNQKEPAHPNSTAQDLAHINRHRDPRAADTHTHLHPPAHHTPGQAQAWPSGTRTACHGPKGTRTGTHTEVWLWPAPPRALPKNTWQMPSLYLPQGGTAGRHR